MKKHLLFLMLQLAITSSLFCAAEETTSASDPAQASWSLSNNPITRMFGAAGSQFKKALKEMVDNNEDITKAQENIRKNKVDFNHLKEDLSCTIKSLDQEHGISIPLSMWAKYSEVISKNEIKNASEALPENMDEVFKKISGTTDDIKVVSAYIQKIMDLHKQDYAPVKSAWEANKAAYEQLDAQLNSSSSKHYAFTALRWMGYATVFTAGPYLGNKAYTTFLSPYFTKNQVDHSDVMQRIITLEEECDALMARLEKTKTALHKSDTTDSARENKLKVNIQRLETTLATARQEIESLTTQMSLPQEPAAWRTYAGIGVRVSMIALTTYLFYTVFKKIDENYLTLPDASLIDKNALREQLKPLLEIKKAYDAQENIHTQLDTVLKSNNAQLAHTIAFLRSRIEAIISHFKHDHESAEHLEEMKLQSIMQIFNI
jgi:hypothetical protein